MARTRAVFAEGKWNRKTLREWVPDAVSDIVRACSPVRVILFGSVARNEEGPDSDLDFLDPGYRVLQVKEKFATLRYYWQPDETRVSACADTHLCRQREERKSQSPTALHQRCCRGGRVGEGAGRRFASCSS
jgi:Nucleotidyltransferase domain